MSTPHNSAHPDQIAPIVLMPGDPLRAKAITEKYLKDPICFNSVRNMLGYTGTYKGQKISVMGSGMGMPSIGIYSYELYRFYNVETILRVGSCGAYSPDLHLRDVVLVDSAWSESTYARSQSDDPRSIQLPDSGINQILVQTAQHLEIPLKPIRIHSSDVFYHEDDKAADLAKQNGCAAVEMESFALFHNAAILGKKAACLCTVSDSFVYTDEELTSQERQQDLDTMICLGLESATRFDR